MPATPAWPPRALPRLFVEQPLGPDHAVLLEGKPAHYLSNVLRLGEGAQLLVFDGDSGEWRARIEGVAKRRLVLRVVDHVRPAETLPPLTLAFAPVKRASVEWLVEKATELGVARLLPVATQRTVIERLNPERLRAIAIEAAEQCGRTRLPELAEPVKLAALLRDSGGTLLFADETGGVPLLSIAAPGPATILIGPEGGFTPDEREAILAAGAHGVGLGPRILRAETAALAAVTLYMAGAGDWR
ncbi:16S rRNA (uracil(1498)-N(3))-methyltransferase [Sphingomonas astaxanthinifaciens]|uniref:Ribosomal RNA small subunit methyltransferase E n=1 Tax=Sphingomonas astaxanthinifaciens DSM 22298 TaxID=1123267 RepID=A0ABQ5Z628_9SPHN|nr:16S rRNA (uracil(1498)-N(3))-methyltransferase [Sphingomonas astaxanthinifaciens]GLR48158.1 ribosomal RNA small subunit methyltransferase E [Sphingomonas astaxanthinifaciens DSM 22298]